MCRGYGHVGDAAVLSKYGQNVGPGMAQRKGSHKFKDSEVTPTTARSLQERISILMPLFYPNVDIRSVPPEAHHKVSHSIP
jgi:hypothetical protein